MKTFKFTFWLCVSLLLSTALTTAQESAFFVSEIAWNPDGSRVAVGISEMGPCLSADENFAIKIINPVSQSITEHLTDFDCSVTALAYSPSGDTLFIATGATTINLNLITNKRIGFGQGIDYNKVIWSLDGKTILTQSVAGISIEDPITFTRTGYFIPVNEDDESVGISDSSWNQTSNLVAVGDESGGVSLWKPATNEQVLYVSLHSAAVQAVEWSPDAASNLVISGDESGTIHIWNGIDGEIITTITDHTDSIYDLEWSPDGQYFAAASKDGTVKLWDVMNTGEPLYSFDYGAPAHVVTWKPDSTQYMIAFGGESLTGAPGEVVFQTIDSNPTLTETPVSSPTSTPVLSATTQP